MNTLLHRKVQFSVYKHWCYKETIGSSSFNTFAQSPISEPRNILENITAVTTVHHALNPEESRPFDNNGEGDGYPEDIEDTGIFWGKDRNDKFRSRGGASTGPCYWTYTECTYRFWINWGCSGLKVDPNPVSCP